MNERSPVSGLTRRWAKMRIPIVRALLAIVISFSAGCLFSSYGYRHRITYLPRDEAARVELAKKVEEQNILQGIPGAQWIKRADIVFVSLELESKQMTSPEFRELRRRVEAAIGADLLKRLKTSSDWHPIP